MPALDAESRQTAPVLPAPARPARPVVVDFYEEEEKLDQTLAALQQRVNQFRTQKETLKAQYTAANALTSVNESVARISNTLGDSSAALERAQEKSPTCRRARAPPTSSFILRHSGQARRISLSGRRQDVKADARS